MRDVRIGMRIALVIMMVIFLYLFAITFLDMPEAGIEQAKTISPFLLGIIATMVGFYWGNSSKNKQNTPVDDAAIEAAKIEAVKVVEEKKP
jgi:hypothetical protein